MINQQGLTNYLKVERNLEPGSIRQVISRVKVFERWLGSKSISKEAISDFCIHLKDTKAPNTYNTYVYSLRELDRFMGTSYSSHLKQLKRKRQRRLEILSISELKRLLMINLSYGIFHGKSAQSLNKTYRALNYFLAHTGARFSEASGLRVSDCDLLEGKCWFIDTKNGEDRQAYIQEPVLVLLRELCEEKEGDSIVFTNAAGGRIHPQDYGVDLKRRAHKAGIKKHVHTHLFRHSFATHLLANGVEITKVAGLLGHRDIQTTYENYVHLASEILQQASKKFPLNMEQMPADEQFKQLINDLRQWGVFDNKNFKYVLTGNVVKISLGGDEEKEKAVGIVYALQ